MCFLLFYIVYRNLIVKLLNLRVEKGFGDWVLIFLFYEGGNIDLEN